MNRYNKPIGWRYESHKHSLAARGVKTKYNARKISAFGSFVTGAGQIAAGSQDPTTDFAKRYRKETEQQRTGIISAPGVAARAKAARIVAEPQGLTPAEAVLKKHLEEASRTGKTSGEEARDNLVLVQLAQRQQLVDEMNKLTRSIHADSSPEEVEAIEIKLDILRNNVRSLDGKLNANAKSILRKENKLAKASDKRDAIESEKIIADDIIDDGEKTRVIYSEKNNG